ncbi:MAG: nucleotidyltransferase family protein [Bacteroidetes bacterium]|nr:nucleotidyltransferase family protein [Bacteroidota bacterium]
MSSRFGAGNSGFSAEMKLLLLCCRCCIENSSEEITRYISSQSFDWPIFVALVATHRMFPMVHQILKKSGTAIPVPVLHEIADNASKNLKRMMNLAGELNALHQLLGTNNITFISMKGPLMVHQLYGSYSCRQTRDLDILVEEADINAAISVLSGAGYHLIDGYFCRHPEKRTLYLKRENHVRFRHPHKMIFLELHWTVSKYFTTIETAALFDHKTQIVVHGRIFNTFSMHDYFIVLATHGIYHRYELLFWLYDIGHLMSMPEINRNELLATAEKFNCTTSVNVSLALAHSLFNLRETGDFRQLKKLTTKEQFIYNQCVDTITGTGAVNPASRFSRFINTVRQRFSSQIYLMLMTDDRASKKRVLVNTLIKPYVWEDSAKIPHNNLVYLVLTQVKWMKFILSGRMNKLGKIRKK